MNKRIFLFLFMLIFLPNYSYAEIKTFTHTVKQPFGGSQSPDDARIAAIAKAKREVLEKAGTYLETSTLVKAHQVEKDEILALAAAVLKAEVVSQKNYASEDSFGIILKAKVDVDTSILDERVETLLRDRTLLDKYKENNEREKELLVRIKELEEENQKLKSMPQKKQEQEKETLEKQLKNTIQSLSANELITKTLALIKDGKFTDFNRANEYLNDAARLDSNFALAYVNKGLAWYRQGDYDRAISDYNKAIELFSNYNDAYNNMGGLINWEKQSDLEKAMLDSNKANFVNPNLALAYSNRGLAWYRQGDYDRAISDYNKAIGLFLNYHETKNNIDGMIIWDKQDDSQNAIENSHKNVVNSKFSLAYKYRGILWYRQGDYGRAISDYNKTIELNPTDTNAYTNRGDVWIQKGNYGNACSDWQKACEIGTCDKLKGAKEKGYCK